MNINQDGTYSSGPVQRPSGGPTDVPPPSGKEKKRRRPPRPEGKKLLLPILVVLLAVLLSNSVYTLKEDQYGVITTFGVPSTVSTSGLKFKLPFIQHVTKVTKTIQGFPLGYRIGSSQSVEEESLMITYDYNFVNIDFYVEYRVTDPIRYLYNSEDPVAILRMLCQSYIRDTIGLYNVDAVITTGKSEIQAAIKEKVIRRLEQEDIGIQLTNITIQDAEPPTAEVQRAFTAVETAKQSADTMVNNARRYANEVIPAAEADADQILRSAEAYREARINEARGQAARFSALFEEYQRFPLITKQRLFYEAMEQILPELRIFMVDPATGIQTALPISPFPANLVGGEAS